MNINFRFIKYNTPIGNYYIQIKRKYWFGWKDFEYNDTTPNYFYSESDGIEKLKRVQNKKNTVLIQHPTIIIH